MRYKQFKSTPTPEILDEVKMSPSALQKFVNSPEAEGMLLGIEFEMGVPNVDSGNDESVWELDYDQNERASSIDGIIDFFRSGEFSNMSSREASALRDEWYQQFQEWQDEKISDNLDESELADRIRDRLIEELDWTDYVEEAEAELEAAGELPDDEEDPDARSQAINLKAKELLENYVDEELMGNSRDYERAYDDIRDEMYDEMRNDSDYDEEEWLSDIGVDDMQDAAREWNLDWPHMYDANEGGEVSLDQVADDFSDALGGVTVRTNSSYHGAQRDGRSWIIEPDGSIDADSGDAGLEFVSPPMPLADGIEMIKRVKKWASSYGCYTNDSTGLHMNISVPDMSTEKLDYVKLALFMGDEHVLRQFGRQYNTYCKSAMSKIRDRIRPEEVSTILSTVKQNLNSLASKIIHSGITEKYTSINTRDKYVEFRGPGGDYLDRDPIELVNTALRLAMSLRIATNPEAYKQEYAKKLYKLVEQSDSKDDSVKLFSQYALGELNKDELLARVKFAQRGRQIEKNLRNRVTRMTNDPQIKQKINDLPTAWRNMLRDDLPTTSEQELQGLIDSINSGREDFWINPEQRELVKAIVANELAVRQAEGEKKQYWVSNRKGEGGKQMVYAHNENEAILIGGKNIGLNREQSISKLKAVERQERTPEQMLASLPEDWREWFDKIGDASTGVLRGGLDAMTTGRWQYRNLDDEQVNFIKVGIENEMRTRQDNGVVDNNETRWKVKASISVSNRNYDPVYVDADSPRQAKLKAVEIFRREQNLIISVDDLDAIATTQDAGQHYGEENTALNHNVMNTLPPAYQHWLQNIGDHSDIGIINTLNNPRTYGDLNDQQAAYFRIRIKRELRSRGINPDTATPSPTNPYADDAAERERMRREREQLAATMQTQLVNRDDPVSSNDPEAQDGAGYWMIGNHEYGRETFFANSRDEAIRTYVERNGIDADTLTSSRSFVAQLRNPNEHSQLGLFEMLKLAGIDKK